MSEAWLAFGVGALGGLVHLGVVAARADLVGRGRLTLAILTGPLGWLGPIGAVAAVLRLAPHAAWAVLPGLIVARTVVLARMSGVPWRR